jgi:hypothetical protein
MRGVAEGAPMGAWGSGNFQQDGALDFVHREVQPPLLRTIQKLVADPASAQADDPDSGPIVAAVEILALLVEQTNAAPPKPDEVHGWKDLFLAAWDRTAKDVYFREAALVARREVIVATFDRLERAATRFHDRAD